MGKGNDEIFLLADCAADALIIRPNAAVSSVFLRFIKGKQDYKGPPRRESGWYVQIVILVRISQIVQDGRA